MTVIKNFEVEISLELTTNENLTTSEREQLESEFIEKISKMIKYKIEKVVPFVEIDSAKYGYATAIININTI